MMKDAGHFDQIRRLRILDGDLVPFVAAYDVREVVKLFHCTDVCMATFHSRLHLPS